MLLTALPFMKSSVPPLEFVASSVNRSGSSTSNTVAKPTGTLDGDLMIAFVFKSGNASITPPAGWTSLGIADVSNLNDAFVRTAGPSEGADYTFTFVTSTISKVAVLTYRGGVGELDATGIFNRVNINTATSTADSITALNDGVLIAAFRTENGTGTSNVSTPPAGMTNRVSSTGSQIQHPSLAIYDLSPSVAGSSGTKSLVWSRASTEGKSAVLIQIR